MNVSCGVDQSKELKWDECSIRVLCTGEEQNHTHITRSFLCIMNY